MGSQISVGFFVIIEYQIVFYNAKEFYFKTRRVRESWHLQTRLKFVAGKYKISSGGNLMWDIVISQGQIFDLQAI